MLPSVHHTRYRLVQADLRALRKSAGLTQVDLAILLGVDQSFVSRLEQGERYVDLLFYIDWCRACGVEPSAAVTRLINQGV
ncbi:helix-turn-helix transcriptional regulator [Burkholderia cepacia]|uniref:helix-turn-helix domain-containing protein n=1 Tax=Burkholderia cepacia TaxID=292 RepID=UPI00264FDCEE|nr:helix-turn-helix transcriptional regulator [Burkholderia cepacia]MDN7857996.1 helix-turn-helix transcriptional regulator [Burkholderia cepacia]